MTPPDFQTFRRPCHSLTVASSSRISWEFTKKLAKKHKRKAIKGEGGPVILLAVTGWAAGCKHSVFSLASGCRQILKELKILSQDTFINNWRSAQNWVFKNHNYNVKIVQIQISVLAKSDTLWHNLRLGHLAIKKWNNVIPCTRVRNWVTRQDRMRNLCVFLFGTICHPVYLGYITEFFLRKKGK